MQLPVVRPQSLACRQPMKQSFRTLVVMSPFAVLVFCISPLSLSCALCHCISISPPLSSAHPFSQPSASELCFLASSGSVLCLIWFFFFLPHAVVLLEKKNGTEAPVTAVSLSVSISGSLSKDQLLLHSYVIAFRWMPVPLTVGGSQAVSHSVLLLNVSLGRWVKSSVTICLDVQLYSVSHRKVIVCLFDKGK